MGSQLILDRYRPLRELGRGGFGTVVLAWDTRLQRRVAIKRLPFPVDAAGVPRRPPGLTEARTAAMLSHPAVITALDFETDNDEAFLIMEYVDGISLDRVLDEANGPLTLDEAAAIAEPVAGALEHAHDNGVLHLDIKPENVLVTRDGRVKVTDFGIAALSSYAGHGEAGGGTPGYMPLEQLEGREVSERTDEWAFAALVYEALTCTNPFAETTRGGAAARLAVHEPPAPSSIVEDLPPDLDDVLLVALSDRPADRYPDVTAFADALLAHLGDPDAGRSSLAGLVEGRLAEVDAHDAFEAERIGMWDRLRGRTGALLVRIVGAVEAAWLSWAGLAPAALEPAAHAAAAGLAGLAGALAPSLGVGLGLGCVVAGLAMSGLPLAAAAAGLAGAAWWWWLARRSAGVAVLPLAAPALGAAGLGMAQPLLAGFALGPLQAAVSAALGGALALLASAATLREAPYATVGLPVFADPWHLELSMGALVALVTSPATYVALAAWPLAAALMSMLSTRATRASAMFGAVGGAAVLVGGYALADQVAHLTAFAEPVASWLTPSLAGAVTGSFILVALVIALGAPVRPEGDAPAPEEDFDD